MQRKYKLIAVAVEAMKLEPSNVEHAAIWCGGVPVTEIDPFDSTQKFVALNIPTLTGAARVTDGDYIVKDLGGGFSKMTAQEFESQFEEI